MTLEERIERTGLRGYEFAAKIGMSEHRLYRLLNGRVKNISPKDIKRISVGLKLKEEDVRADLDRRANKHRIAEALAP